MGEYVKQSREYDTKIAAGAAEREKDRAIWKSYSKRGGIHDALQDFCKAVRRPSANAFDYDEEEGTYIICITLYNTIWSRMDAELARLDRSLAAAEKQSQNYVPATRTRTFTRTRKVPKSSQPQAAGKTSGIVRCLKALDKWMMRFSFYAAMHRAIAGLFPRRKRAADVPVTQQYECRETVYEEGEVQLASYRSVHAGLLQVMRTIDADMGKSLPLIQGEDRPALERYKQEAKRICSDIEENVFSKQEWVL